MSSLGRELLSTEISDGVATMHLIRSFSSTTQSSHRIFRSQDIRLPRLLIMAQSEVIRTRHQAR